jgi:MFS family permease
MAGEPEIQLSRLLDERGLSSFQIRVLAWSILIAIIDGYDITAISFAAPHLVAAWGVERGALGPVLSASNFGFLFGAAIFGWVGDRYGRKAALITASLLFGVFTFAAAYATDLTQLFWLRLIAGFGIGGVIPNVVAINAESAPRSLRATLAIVAMVGVPLGGTAAGFAAAALRSASSHPANIGSIRARRIPRPAGAAISAPSRRVQRRKSTSAPCSFSSGIDLSARVIPEHRRPPATPEFITPLCIRGRHLAGPGNNNR